MAFQPATDNAPATGTSNAPPRRNGDFEKALGFLNFYIPTKGGTRRKVGSIPLNASKATEKQVFDALAADPAALERFVKALIVEFNPQIDESAESSQLDF